MWSLNVNNSSLSRMSTSGLDEYSEYFDLRSSVVSALFLVFVMPACAMAGH